MKIVEENLGKIIMGSLGLVETQLRQYLFWAQRLESLGEKGFQSFS